MAANRLPASWMNALDPAAGARRSRLTAARVGAPRCPYISRRSRPASGQTLTVPSSDEGNCPDACGRLSLVTSYQVPMRLIGLVLVLSIALVPPVARAQSTRVARVGILSTGNPRSAAIFQAFEQRLRELGYAEGQNLVIEFRNAEGKTDRLPGLAAE